MAPLLVDTNVVLDVLEDDPRWFEWSASELEHLASSYRLTINPVIYSELSFGFGRIEELEEALELMKLSVQPVPKEALFLAGKAFLQYRRQQGRKRSPLPDFYIGAHATVQGSPLLTRDPKRYRHYFPNLTLLAP